MNVNDHPELEALQNYLNHSSADEFYSLRLHLAQCSQCRATVSSLIALKDIPQLLTNTLSDTQYQQIDDYINNRLSPDDQRKQKAFIDANPEAMKAALHYASLKSASNRASTESTTNTTSRISLWPTLADKIRKIITFKAPVWISIPTAALFIALLSFNLYELKPTQAPYIIASYQDNPVIQFRSNDNLPGIGFFAKSEQSAVEYQGIDIQVTDNKSLTIHWPAIANAVKYTLRLHVFNQGNKMLVGNISTDTNSAFITTELDSIFHRYEWVLSGETADQRVFMAKGGFVINQPDKDNL